MHYFSNTPTDQKKQCPLKEVLTQRCVRTQRASPDKSTTHSRNDARNPTAADIGICQRCRKCLNCRHFLNSCSVDRRAIVIALSRKRRRKAARGERRVVIFGNEKNFVGKMTFASFEVVQTGLANESRLQRFAAKGLYATVNGRCETRSRRVETRATTSKPTPQAHDRDGSRANDNVIVLFVQMPSLDFKRSLTACGFALPPDDFIT